ncbi:MAG: hydroxymethylglutaryl-CoA reductase, degradative [Chloroflexi bacterium HGW-Chloroflexi-8]|nr:MAG: hydroxymethylglutaryl-CoA reductase, degradative [Chloroflexi bacterium HGW-Chloroflexi-8]
MDFTPRSDKKTKFYDLSPVERLEWIAKNSTLDPEKIEILSGTSGLTIEKADNMVENVVGVFGLPLGIAQNFLVNGREILVPMVVEEPSIIAGASFMAKLARPAGGFFAHLSASEMIAQIQVIHVPELNTARLKLLEAKSKLLELAAQVDPVLTKLGGGPRDLEVRIFENSAIGPFIVIHLIFDVRDAMGANAINTAAERLAPQIEEITGGKVHLRILSNLADRRLARARATFHLDQLAFDDYTAEEVRDGIIAAWAFAAVDPYRAATHNKGIMNGVDPIVIATGNDWRAVEAGAHAFAAKSGKYTSLTTWSKDENGNLVGTIEMPMAVGIVGGATRVHPTAKVSLELMKIKSASELAEVIVSVGLAQNLAALRALATEGIQRGHMGLHARQVAIAAGAKAEEITKLASLLASEKLVRIDRAQEILKEWRNE